MAKWPLCFGLDPESLSVTGPSPKVHPIGNFFGSQLLEFGVLEDGLLEFLVTKRVVSGDAKRAKDKAAEIAAVALC